jgi:hypothetical protein
MVCSKSQDFSRLDAVARHLKGKRHAKKLQRSQAAATHQRSIADQLRTMQRAKVDDEKEIKEPKLSAQERAFRINAVERCVLAGMHMEQIGAIADLIRPVTNDFSLPNASVLRRDVLPLALGVEEDRVKELIKSLSYGFPSILLSLAGSSLLPLTVRRMSAS